MVLGIMGLIFNFNKLDLLNLFKNLNLKHPKLAYESTLLYNSIQVNWIKFPGLAP